MFRPFTMIELAEEITKALRNFENLSDDQRASGDFIDPDEPIVLQVPNPQFDEHDAKPLDSEDSYGNSRYLYYHVMSCGGGGDTDDNGEECGHDGFEMSGMRINGREFLANGRRREK
jgi:hypothetical protein